MSWSDTTFCDKRGKFSKCSIGGRNGKDADHVPAEIRHQDELFGGVNYYLVEVGEILPEGNWSSLVEGGVVDLGWWGEAAFRGVNGYHGLSALVTFQC